MTAPNQPFPEGTYIRLCGSPVAGTITGPNGTGTYVKRKGKWVRV